MHHSQSYPVTSVQVSPPQPHLSYATKSPPNKLLCSGWCAWVVAGVFAFAFLVGVFQFGRQRLFLVAVDPTADLVLTVKQGSLQVYPFLVKTDFGVESRYFTHLPPQNLSQMVDSLDALFRTYPGRHEPGQHRNCWLENPLPERPCFFDASWLGEVCAPRDSYGYEERDGHFSPCLLLRLEQTGDWRPRYTENIPMAIADHYDPGFSPVHCYVKGERNLQNLTVYPPKGFSHLFFPASRFDPGRFLLPLVAVKLHSIPRGAKLTLECSVVTPNAFFLWNNGKAVIRFEAA